MKIKQMSVCFILIFIIAASGSAADRTINATADDGRKVILNPDGTWKFSGQEKPSGSASGAVYTRPATSKKLVKTINEHFSIWIDESKWSQTKTNDVNRSEFQHIRGDAGAIIISERIGMTGMTTDLLKNIVMENAGKASKDAVIIFEEKRIVNGLEVLCMKFEGTVSGIFFIYFGYYFAGDAGSIQVITYTGKNLFDEYKNDFLDFLNGLEITIK